MSRRYSLHILAAGAALAAAAAPLAAQGKKHQAKAQPRFALSMLAGGQTVDLGSVVLVSGPRDILAGASESADGRGTKHPPAPAQPDKAATPEPVVLDVPASDEAITKRLNDAHQCVADGHGDGCRFEATLNELDSAGAVRRSLVARGAWVSGFEAANVKAKSATPVMRLTLAYQSLAPAGSAAVAVNGTPGSGAGGPAAMTTGVSNGSVASAGARADSAPQAAPQKKHKGFGHFVGGLIKDHGLQVVQIATGVGAASMVLHSLKVSGAAAGPGGAWNPSAQSQFAGLAQQIITTPGMHQINAGLPPGVNPGGPVDPIAAQAYANAVRAQLIAQGVDPSRFTVTAGGVAASALTAAAVSAMSRSSSTPASSLQPSAPPDSTKKGPDSHQGASGAKQTSMGGNATP